MSQERVTQILEKTLQINNTFGSTAIKVDTQMHITTYSVVLTGNQASQTILTPSSGFKLCIRSVSTTVDGNAGDITLDFATSNKPVHRHYSTGAGEKSSGGGGHILGAVDEVLTFSATALGASELFMIINYVEHT